MNSLIFKKESAKELQMETHTVHSSEAMCIHDCDLTICRSYLLCLCASAFFFNKRGRERDGSMYKDLCYIFAYGEASHLPAPREHSEMLPFFCYIFSERKTKEVP